MSKQIIGKSVGKNVILIIEDVKHSRAFATKEERTAILDKVKAYNEKNSAAKLKELKSIMDTDVVAKVEEFKKVAKKKADKIAGVVASLKPEKEAKPKEADVVIPEQSIEASIMFLLEKGYSVQKTQEKPQVSAPKRGEW